jgi:hypothetical protein
MNENSPAFPTPGTAKKMNRVPEARLNRRIGSRGVPYREKRDKDGYPFAF